MRVLAGLGAPELGEVRWQGQSIRRDRDRFHQNMAWLGHQAGLKADLSLLENITFDNDLRRQHPAQQVRAMLNTLGIESRLDVPARGLSAGQRRRLALARVMLSDAPLWLLDEPFTNLDTDGQALVRTRMALHAGQGGCIVFAAHSDVQIEGTHIRRLEWQP